MKNNKLYLIKLSIFVLIATIIIISSVIVIIVYKDKTKLNIDEIDYSNVSVLFGTGKSFGDLVKIGTEEFYVIEYNQYETKLLAKYNLNVGGVYKEGKYEEYESPTNMQDEKMMGYKFTDGEYHGVTAFSEYNSKYETSIIKTYVNKYSELIKKKFNVDNTASLLTVKEIESYGMKCYLYNNSLEDKKWLYDRSYWLLDPGGSGNIWYVFADDGMMFIEFFSNNKLFGVRPVITVPSAYIEGGYLYGK